MSSIDTNDANQKKLWPRLHDFLRSCVTRAQNGLVSISGGTIIEFDPSLKSLSSKDRNEVRKCPWFLRQIEARQEKFKTSKIIIKGVSFVGEGKKRKILKIDARPFYKKPDDKDASYHVCFMPDAGILLVIFCTAAENATRPQKNNPNSFQDYHVLMIEQPRWGADSLNSLEPMGGLLTDDEKVDVGSIQKGIMREALEEGGEAIKGIFNQCSALQQISLGEPVTLHPCVTDKQYQSYVVIHSPREELQATKTSLEGKFGGIEAEGERTKPIILSFIDAWETSLKRGTNGHGHFALARFAMEYPDRPDQSYTNSMYEALLAA